MASSPSGDMRFHEFCSFLNKLRGKANDLSRKRHKLGKYFRDIKTVSKDEEDFQIRSKDIISILMSDANEERKLDIGKKKLIDLVCKVVGISKNSRIALLDTRGEGIVATELAEKCADRLETEASSMTVSEICKRLDAIAQDSANKEREMEHFVQNCSKDELIWIFNIMLRNTEGYLGLSRKAILECISPEASDIWKDTRDLNRVTNCPADITDPDYYLGMNFRPQLLARLSLDTIDEQVNLNLKGGFFMEKKYDGEHVIMHKKGTTYTWFTRNGKNFTEHYGSHHKEKLAEQIHSVFKSSVEECIIDCELMQYDEKRAELIRHLEKNGDGDTFNYRNPKPGYRIVVVVFDLLYFCGKVRGKEFKDNLMQVPLVDRVEIMQDRLLKRNEKHNIFILDRTEGTTGQEIRDFYKQAIEDGEEGIAVKRKDSLYYIGERAKRNGWFKLKNTFDIDLVIVGHMLAKDKRGMAFLLAAWDDSNNYGPNLRVICKSYSGLKDIDKDKIKDDARSAGPLLKGPPDCLTGWKDKSKYLYYRPENYVVVEATSFGIRNHHLIDVIMKRIRTDKSICKEDIDDYKTIMEHQPGINDISSHKDSEASTSTEKIKPARITKKGVFDTGAAPPSKKVRRDSEISTPLTGRTVCVLQGFDKALRGKCWEILEKFGAKVIANPSDNMHFIVAPSENHVKVKTAMKKGTHSVVKGDWVLRCEQEGSVQSWRPSDLILEIPGGFNVE